MQMKILCLLCLSLGLAGSGWAQGSGTEPRHAPLTRDEPSPFSVRRTFEGKLVAISPAGDQVALENEDGQRIVLTIDDRTRFKADKDTDLSAKKEIRLADFEIGQTVRAIYRTTNGSAIEIKLVSRPVPI